MQCTPEGAQQFRIKPAAATAIERDTIDHAVETIRNRVDALGVTEPLIAPESGNRIVIELPGVDDPARGQDIIKTTAVLQFRLVEASPGAGPASPLATGPDAMQHDLDILQGPRAADPGRPG